MRVYISGPITGAPDYRERFKAAQARLEAAGHTVINPAYLSAVLPDGEWSDYINICLHMLLTCRVDAIYQLDSWEKSKGAMKEYETARKWGIKVIDKVDVA